MPTFLRNWFLPANLIWLLRPFLTVLGLYWLTRFAFVVFYWKNFDALSFQDWIDFLLLSLRFDSSTIFSINLIFIVLVLLPFRFGSIFYNVIRFVFVLGNWVFLTINAADVPFYKFNTRRTSFDSIRFLATDFLNQLPQLFINFWPLVLIAFASILFLFKTFPPNPPKHRLKFLNSIYLLLFWTVISVGAIRNSFQLKPLLPGEAFALSQAEAGHGALNTPFLLFKTIDLKPIPDSEWMKKSELDQQFPGQNFQPSGNLKGQNVVLLILESFATEYTGLEGNPLSYTPFLDSLAKEGLHFPHHFSNGRTSRDALPSIFSSIPAWMDESFCISQYQSIDMDGLGKRLVRSGYATRFYHGGKNGTMSFDMFSRMAGFQKYIGLNEYPDSEDFDGNWGVFDEPFLQFMADDLAKLKQPFGAAAFTLSSHQPYSIPEKYKGQFKKGPLPIHEVIGYSDHALRRFFAKASRMPWFENTIFVITADHTQEGIDPRYSSIAGLYDVPLILFHPKRSLVADTSQWVQHLDVAPTISDLLGLKVVASNRLGESVFHPKQNHPIQYQDNMFYMIHPKSTISWRAEDVNQGWSFDPKAQTSDAENFKSEMKSRIQYYRMGLIHNEMFNKVK